MPLSKTIQKFRSFLKSSKKPLLVICGPTASGKTSLAVRFAKIFEGEVINADSRQIYQEMKIGNELTKPEEMQGIPHHLFSYIPLSQTFTVAEYKSIAEKTIEDILDRKKLPILCGGSVMWIDAVVDNYQIPEGKPDMDYRQQLESKTTYELLSDLRKVDNISADKLEKGVNRRYIIRALEIYHQTGKSKSEIPKKKPRKYNVFKIAPFLSRDEIYDRINSRTVHQVRSGMISEVQCLVDKYANGNPSELLQLGWPSISSIGCKEVIPYLSGDCTKEELIAQLQQNNRNYAKRQFTWLKKDAEINWVNIDTENDI